MMRNIDHWENMIAKINFEMKFQYDPPLKLNSYKGRDLLVQLASGKWVKNPAVRRGTVHIRIDPKQPIIVDFNFLYSTDKIVVVIFWFFLNALDGRVPPCSFHPAPRRRSKLAAFPKKNHYPPVFLTHFFSPRNWRSQPRLGAVLRTCGIRAA